MAVAGRDRAAPFSGFVLIRTSDLSTSPSPDVFVCIIGLSNRSSASGERTIWPAELPEPYHSHGSPSAAADTEIKPIQKMSPKKNNAVIDFVIEDHRTPERMDFNRRIGVP
ncbi:hypothetical protein [Methanoculleus sp.]|uniref:hypothetical protein n=1 Tax=Methanoculleus sp. TaxID=90427 RepID=UPI002FC681AC